MVVAVVGFFIVIVFVATLDQSDPFRAINDGFFTEYDDVC